MGARGVEADPTDAGCMTQGPTAHSEVATWRFQIAIRALTDPDPVIRVGAIFDLEAVAEFAESEFAGLVYEDLVAALLANARPDSSEFGYMWGHCRQPKSKGCCTASCFVSSR